MQKTKVPQIVDGDHVLSLGKDEIIRRLVLQIATVSYGNSQSAAQGLSANRAFTEKHAVQLLQIYL